MSSEPGALLRSTLAERKDDMIRKKSQARLLSEADKLFKTNVTKAPSDYEEAQRSFHENRERLKSERLTREAELTRGPGNR